MLHGYYTGPHTHAILMPTHASSNIGTLVASHARLVPTLGAPQVGTDVATHAKPMPTLGSARVGTLVATQESCQLSANVDTGEGVDACHTRVLPLRHKIGEN